jgi:hypothetical protein
MMADDKTLSEKLLDSATALGKWKEMEPIVNEAKSLVNEYSEIIDGVGSVSAVVGFVWNIYSNMEKAKENAAQQQAMVRTGKFWLLNADDGPSPADNP